MREIGAAKEEILVQAYTRVSTAGQNLDSQIDALTAAGCSKIFTDKASGSKESRPEWDRLMEYLRPSDTLVVAELSRMSRSLMHTLHIVKDSVARGINLVSLREHIDTTTATGRAFIGMIGVVKQLEARSEGRTGGGQGQGEDWREASDGSGQARASPHPL